jgi:hypothetical protein
MERKIAFDFMREGMHLLAGILQFLIGVVYKTVTI